MLNTTEHGERNSVTDLTHRMRMILTFSRKTDAADTNAMAGSRERPELWCSYCLVSTY